jgi:tRNA A37 threonylcarbamoyladenosine dehydratase
MTGRFARTERLLGKEAVALLARQRVLVAGLGAVGSYAVEALARAGIGALRLVDFDVVQLSNINRQLYALESTLGRSKVEVARERVLDINPDCRVEAWRLFIDETTLPRILDGPPEVVVDAIDSLNPKVQLLAAASATSAYLVSSMGAASRTDPSRVRTGDLWQTRGCPLARLLRKRLRRLDCHRPIRCVYSTETPFKRLPEAGGEEPAPLETFHRGRPRQPLGSYASLTGIFGLTAANEAIRFILGWGNGRGVGDTGGA